MTGSVGALTIGASVANPWGADDSSGAAVCKSGGFVAVACCAHPPTRSETVQMIVNCLREKIIQTPGGICLHLAMRCHSPMANQPLSAGLNPTECLSYPPVRILQRLWQDARPTHRRHKVCVAHPAWNDVNVHMLLHTGARRFASCSERKRKLGEASTAVTAPLRSAASLRTGMMTATRGQPSAASATPA